MKAQQERRAGIAGKYRLYAAIPGLRIEARQKLTKIRPVTFGQAGRISGITPADLALVSVWLQKYPASSRLGGATP